MLTYLPVFTYCDHDIWYKDVTLKPNHLKDRAKKTQNFGHNNRLIKRQLKSTISSSACETATQQWLLTSAYNSHDTSDNVSDIYFNHCV